MEYEVRMKALSDEKSRIEGAKLEGMVAGLAAGKFETARNLQALGADVPFIMKATGLSEKEFEVLRPTQW
jgi:predicted transposase/invertase (TIGR01784 family)